MECGRSELHAQLLAGAGRTLVLQAVQAKADVHAVDQGGRAPKNNSAAEVYFCEILLKYSVFLRNVTKMQRIFAKVY